MTNKKQRIIMLADAQSFYASVEKASHPEYKQRPLIVAGDPARRSGIVLAACPLAKSRGITTAERLGEALGKCPDLIVVQPRMQHYIQVSMQITRILQSFTDLVEPYSIDEQFLDVSASLHLFGDPLDIARQIQTRIRRTTGIQVRVGISYSKVTAKMACDNFAKKRSDGLFYLRQTELQSVLWPLPVHTMFSVGSRMTKHLMRLGIHTVGDLAQQPLSRLRAKWGINGELLWQTANGIDPSPVHPGSHEKQKAFGHQMTLPRDYEHQEDIAVVLLELTELVCQRCRSAGLMGTVVSVGCRGADFDRPTGFHRQMTLPDPTNVTKFMYEAVMHLFEQHWNGYPVRRVGVSLSGLVSDACYQLSLFDDAEKYMALERATDAVKQKYGNASVMRAASLLTAGQAADRSQKIGGHYK